MKKPIDRKSDDEMRQSYPIVDRLAGWYFRLTETTNNVWLAEGSDVRGRTVSCQGHDQDALLAECVERAKRIADSRERDILNDRS